MIPPFENICLIVYTKEITLLFESYVVIYYLC
nr:MAG TPA: hypothetical protein [Caudoviricetes sp.]